MKDKYSNCMRLNVGFWNERVKKGHQAHRSIMRELSGKLP